MIAITCRICHTAVKRVGLLCQDCGLLCHTTCAVRADPRCDIREQLAMAVRQQDLLDIEHSSRAPSPSLSDHLAQGPSKVIHGWKQRQTPQVSPKVSATQLADCAKRGSAPVQVTSGSGLRSFSPFERPGLGRRNVSSSSRASASVYSVIGSDGQRSVLSLGEGAKVGSLPGAVAAEKVKTAKAKEGKSDCVVM
jgi:hypothetical protein